MKASLNRYVQDLSLLANNRRQHVDRTTRARRARSWTDSNGNFIPTATSLNPDAQNHTADRRRHLRRLHRRQRELRHIDSRPRFTIATSFGGWNHRGYNWEFSTSVQQEIVPRRVAVDVGYFRRWYGNFIVTDNPLTTAADYDRVQRRGADRPAAAAERPDDQRVPEHQPRQGVAGHDQSRAVCEQLRRSSTEYWHGVDVSTALRPGGGTLVQGGVSIGKQVTDNCEVLKQVPEASDAQRQPHRRHGHIAGPLGTPFCHQEQPWLAQVKGLGTYTIPRIDVQVAATFQNVPGPQLAATLVVPNATVQPVARSAAVGRRGQHHGAHHRAGQPLRRSAVSDPTSASARSSGSARTVAPTASVDLFNLFNGNAGAAEQPTILDDERRRSGGRRSSCSRRGSSSSRSSMNF